MSAPNFDGSAEIAALVGKLKSEALAELASIDAAGGVVRAIESGVLKARLVESKRGGWRRSSAGSRSSSASTPSQTLSRRR